MLALTAEQFTTWTKGGHIEETVYFVIVKTKNCPKCMTLTSKAGIFGKMQYNFATFTFEPGNTNTAAEVLAGLEIMSVPTLIFRYKHENKWQIGKIPVDDLDDLQNIFDAINDNDQFYFGYNEFDEAVESDADIKFNRLLHLIHGEIDAEKMKEHRAFKKEVIN